jgi:hypothetical protein
MGIEHGQWVLNHIREYDSFLDSLTTIADMGCGEGKHIEWWATLATRDDDPQPYNYKCYAVDNNAYALSKVPNHPNIIKIERDFSEKCIPTSVDLMFAHDSLQYSVNPLETLKVWNEQMTVNGMLVLSVRQHTGVEHNAYCSRSYSGAFYHFTPVQLIYMLAVNGFDCRDAYLLKRFNDPWIQIAVYKSDVPPMDPRKTDWYQLINKGLLHPTAERSIHKFGYLRQEDILYPWLDRELYYVDFIMPPTEIPPEAGPTIDIGAPNEVKIVPDEPTDFQPKVVDITQRLRAPKQPNKAVKVKPKQPGKKYDT